MPYSDYSQTPPEPLLSMVLIRQATDPSIVQLYLTSGVNTSDPDSITLADEAHRITASGIDGCSITGVGAVRFNRRDWICIIPNYVKLHGSGQEIASRLRDLGYEAAWRKGGRE